MNMSTMTKLKKHLPTIIENADQVIQHLTEIGVVKPSKLEWKKWCRAIIAKDFKKISTMISKGFPINYRLNKYFSDLVNPPQPGKNADEDGAYDGPYDYSSETVGKILPILDLLLVNGLDLANNPFLLEEVLWFFIYTKNDVSMFSALQLMFQHGADFTKSSGNSDPPICLIVEAECSSETKIEILKAVLLHHPEDKFLLIIDQALKFASDEKVVIWLNFVKIEHVV